MDGRDGTAAEATDDELLLFDDQPRADVAAAAQPWRVLVVDDDDQVHLVTRFALADVRYGGQGLLLLQARSATQARQILTSDPAIALILLDVVMETDDAGLKFARWVREELGNRNVRIILRTGQPGQAPERQVILDYDINDYKSKAELTAQRLFTAVVSSLRSYEQLLSIDSSRVGLEKILAATSWLYEKRSISQFVEGVILQIRALVGDAEGALMCTLADRGDVHSHSVRIIAGQAPFALEKGGTIAEQLPGPVCDSILTAMRTQQPQYETDRCVISFQTREYVASAVYLYGHKALGPVERNLLEVFAVNVAAGFDKVYLFEKLAHDAVHDRLTNLRSRASLVDAIDEAARTHREGGSPAALLVLDFDRFRDINDDLGYGGGDQFLALMAQRLLADLSPGEIAARLGGDAFAVLAPGVATQQAALAHAERLRRVLCAPAHIAGREVIPSISIGAAFVGSDMRRAEEVLSDADATMDKAKRLGGGRTAMFDPVPPRPSLGRLSLVSDLSRAIHRNELRLHYQPIVSTKTRRVAGFEALIRWQHPERGLVPPNTFISVVESTGLIVPMGEWVLSEAARQVSDWHRRLPEAPDLFVGVNVSARQFVGNDLVNRVQRVLADTPVAAHHLKLEITESLIMEDPTLAIEELKRLRELGIKLSLDDFGTGYSSLSYLHQFPIDTLKIDRSFVNAMLTRRETMVVMQSICALARNLGMTIVAEGAETDAEVEALADLGCDYIQGFIFSRPVPADEAEFLVRAMAAA